MPLYEYECESCGHRFERIQKFSDPPVEECPVCGRRVRKLLSSPAIQFKGTGWYVTDYARKGGGDASKSDGAKPDAVRSNGAKTDTAKSDGEKPTPTGGSASPGTPDPGAAGSSKKSA